MENKSHALTAGIFTLALLAAAILIGAWLSRDHTDYLPYQLATKLSIPGLSPHANVRYRGLDVGQVEEITFDPQVPGQILIHIRVRPDTPVTKSTYGMLGYQGVTGIAYIELNDDGSNPTPLPSSEQQTARIEMRPGLFDSLQEKGLAILQQTEEATRRINDLLDPANQEIILSAFTNTSKAAASLQTIPAQLAPSLARLPAVLAEAQQSMTLLSMLSNDLSALVTDLQQPEGAVTKLSAAADRIGSLAERMESEALPLASDARSSLRAIGKAVENLSRGPQNILFGSQNQGPGPGEEGFVAPPAK